MEGRNSKLENLARLRLSLELDRPFPCHSLGVMTCLQSLVQSCREYCQALCRLAMIPPKASYERLLAGGLAGAISRTFVAPFERLRTIVMTDSRVGLAQAAKEVYQADGILGRHPSGPLLPFVLSGSVDFAGQIKKLQVKHLHSVYAVSSQDNVEHRTGENKRGRKTLFPKQKCISAAVLEGVPDIISAFSGQVSGGETR